jgi:hypothetical protein
MIGVRTVETNISTGPTRSRTVASWLGPVPDRLGPVPTEVASPNPPSRYYCAIVPYTLSKPWSPNPPSQLNRSLHTVEALVPKSAIAVRPAAGIGVTFPTNQRCSPPRLRPQIEFAGDTLLPHSTLNTSQYSQNSVPILTKFSSNTLNTKFSTHKNSL